MTDYKEIYYSLEEGWHTAKEFNLAAATLNAMERRGMIEVDRNSKPMKYRIKADEKSNRILELFNEIVPQDDFETALVIVHRVRDIDLIKRTSDGYRTWDHKEINERMFNNIEDAYIRYMNNTSVRLEI